VTNRKISWHSSQNRSARHSTIFQKVGALSCPDCPWKHEC